MKLKVKEQSELKLEVGDLVEYSFGGEIIRGIILKDGVDYRFLNLKDLEMAPGVWRNLDDLLECASNYEAFRIIKSKNLEIREV